MRGWVGGCAPIEKRHVVLDLLRELENRSAQITQVSVCFMCAHVRAYGLGVGGWVALRKIGAFVIVLPVCPGACVCVCVCVWFCVFGRVGEC